MKLAIGDDELLVLPESIIAPILYLLFISIITHGLSLVNFGSSFNLASLISLLSSIPSDARLSRYAFFSTRLSLGEGHHDRGIIEIGIIGIPISIMMDVQVSNIYYNGDPVISRVCRHTT